MSSASCQAAVNVSKGLAISFCFFPNLSERPIGTNAVMGGNESMNKRGEGGCCIDCTPSVKSGEVGRDRRNVVHSRFLRDKRRKFVSFIVYM